MKVGFIGFGRMGSALSEGAVRAGSLKKSQVVAIDGEAAAASRIGRASFKRAKNIASLVRESNVIFLCVKPQMMNQVLDEIAVFSGLSTLRNKCFVSIAAGVTIGKIQDKLGKNVAVIRVMPNTPALLGSGMSGVTKGANVSSAQINFVSKILSSVGEVVQVPERLMDAVTAVSGSGPAYVFFLAESMIEAARKLGFSKDEARLLVHQTVYGAGLMLKNRKESAEELRRQVTSPGGTTEAALKEFMRKNLKQIIGSGLRKAAARSRELR